MTHNDRRETSVAVVNLYKSFKLPHEQHNGIKQLVVNIFKRKRGYETQAVLEDISFEVKKGEFFGIVGRNGSGKSTLMKLLAGIYVPDKGEVHVRGSLTPFIELGVGFNPELTGRENVYLNGALLGFNHREVDRMYKKIVEFAELEKFMDQKLKNYSSGMQVRLAFSIAIQAKSDVLLVDEVLAVGDAAFQSKCFDYFNQLKKSDTTVIFISHDKASLERFCDRGVLIDNGKLITSGKITTVLDAYTKIVLNELSHASANNQKEEKVEKNEYVKISHTSPVSSEGNKKSTFSFGETIKITFDVSVERDIINPIFGITVWQKNVEKPVYATNTLIEGNKVTGSFVKGQKITLEFEVPPSLNDGEYHIEPAVANESATIFYDRRPRAAKLFINGSNNPHSIIATLSESVRIINSN